MYAHNTHGNEDMEIDVDGNGRQFQLRVEHSETASDSFVDHTTSRVSYQVNAPAALPSPGFLAPLPTDGGYISDGPDIPGSFRPTGHSRTRQLTAPIGNSAAHGAIRVVPYSAQKTAQHDIGKALVPFGARLPIPQEDDILPNKRRIVEIESPAVQAELHKLNGLVEWQAEEMRNRDFTIKQLNEHIKKSLEGEKARDEEMAAMRQQIVSSQKMLKEIQFQILDARQDALDAMKEAEDANLRANEAEAREKESTKLRALNSAAMAANLAVGYRGSNLVNAGDEDAVEGMLIDLDDQEPAVTGGRLLGTALDRFSNKAEPINSTSAGAIRGPRRVHSLLPSNVDSLGMEDDQTTPTLPQPHFSPVIRRGTAYQTVSEPVPSRTDAIDEVPKPIAARRGRLSKHLSPPPPLRAGQASGIDQMSNFMGLSVDAKLNMIAEHVLLEKPQEKPRSGRRNQFFKRPVKQAVKEKGQNELNTWVRKKMNALLRIEKDKDILKFSNEIYATGTALQRQMATFEENSVDVLGPSLNPLRINWNDMGSRWNQTCCELFLTFVEEAGYAGGQMDEEAAGAIENIFWKRLGAIQTIINQARPQDEETIEAAQRRHGRRDREAASNKRKNSRRSQLYDMRSEVILANGPDNAIPIDELSHAKMAWMDVNVMHSKLGLAGQSSDESPDERDVSIVREMEWRAPEVIRRYELVKKAQGTGLNKFGKRLPGTKPRTRVRRTGVAFTARNAPAGLPINMYNPEWYLSLSSREKEDLAARPAIKFLTHAADEVA